MTRVIAVTGSEGFIGRHVVDSLAGTPGVEVIRIVRPGTDPTPKAGCTVVTGDVLDESAARALGDVHADVLVHLAWSGLSDFRSDDHLDQVGPHLRFLQTSIDAGVQRIVCAGTCLEYGLTEGELDEDLVTRPVVAYAIAKDRLRRGLSEYAEQAGVSWSGAASSTRSGRASTNGRSGPPCSVPSIVVTRRSR